MNSANALLIEVFTEELPPLALRALSQALAQGLDKVLRGCGLLEPDAPPARAFASPRRLAALFPAVAAQASARQGAAVNFDMPRTVAFDASGAPSAALRKRLEKLGCDVTQLDASLAQGDSPKVSFSLKPTLPAAGLEETLQQSINSVLAGLPVPKMMHYQLADGLSTVQFVRPAKGLIALHGNHALSLAALGLQSSRALQGHRYLAPQPITLACATDYESALETEGQVIADFARRRAAIAEALLTAATARSVFLSDLPQARANPDDDPTVHALLDEVCGLVEYPVVYAGSFQPEFLNVPKECLMLTMRRHQKYFPLFDQAGNLVPWFLIVSNMRPADASMIIEGNERVVRPRLADARFFFETDCSAPLYSRVPQLDAVVYHNRLGSQGARTQRLQRLARRIATAIGADADLADRAALLAKADLQSAMVGEFPELQGVMGSYYARHDGEPEAVVQAILAQYQLQRSRLPDAANDAVAASLYLADRLELLVGLWGIGLVPTGDRDPYGLRRAAISLIHEWQAPQAATLSLPQALQWAVETFEAPVLPSETPGAVADFIYERARYVLIQQGIDRSVADAVVQIRPPLGELAARATAVEAFLGLPAAEALAAAHKRLHNLLKKNPVDASVVFQLQKVTEPAEQTLAVSIDRVEPIVMRDLAAGDFAGALNALAALREPVDHFFETVLILSDDAAQRLNRLALLDRLHAMMNAIADLSLLA